MAEIGGKVCGTSNGEMHGKLNGKVRCAKLGKIRRKIRCAIRGGRQGQFSGGTRGPWAMLGPWHPQRTGNPGAAFDIGKPRAAEFDGRPYEVWAGVFFVDSESKIRGKIPSLSDRLCTGCRGQHCPSHISLIISIYDDCVVGQSH